MCTSFASIAAYALDREEEKALQRFASTGSTKPPPFSSVTLTAAQFRWSLIRLTCLQAFVVTGVLVLMGLYGILSVGRHSASVQEFWSILFAQNAHWGALALLGLHGLVMLIAYAVAGGFRDVAFAREPLRMEATPDRLTVSGGAEALSAPWTHWRLGRLECSAVPEEYPMVVLNSFWLVAYSTDTGKERGLVQITADEWRGGAKICARLLNALCAANEPARS